MISLDDAVWSELHGGYRVLYDASKPLKRMEHGEIVWEEFWSNLHHQGGVGVASYAVIPHLVRISAIHDKRDWNLYGLVAIIEVQRHRSENPALPEWLAENYKRAWQDLVTLALMDLNIDQDRLTLRSALSVVALGRGDTKLGAMLIDIETSVIDTYVEEHLPWLPHNN